MVERRPWLDILAHVILLCGVAMVAFPLYVTFVASTQTAQEVASARSDTKVAEVTVASAQAQLDQAQAVARRQALRQPALSRSRGAENYNAPHRCATVASKRQAA